MEVIKAAYSSPSNIAIVKYWGKFGEQFPLNPSLSFTLEKSLTEMSIERTSSKALEIEFYFEDKKNEKFEQKIIKKLDRFALQLPWIKESKFIIHSRNTFPHSTGIASSASSMSALAMCLVEIDRVINKKDELNLELASHLSRIGSGSASRSVFPRAAIWGKTLAHPSSDYHATPFQFELGQDFKNLQDSILIVSDEEKIVSSTAGHELMNSHPHKESRIAFANANLDKLITILKEGDFSAFAEIAEHEALDLHAMMMTSSPSFILLSPKSLSIVQEIRKFRSRENVKITFTIDAGPNIHLLYPLSEKEKVIPFINKLKQDDLFLDVIYDQIGKGPQRIIS